jgi:hypothetical protein
MDLETNFYITACRFYMLGSRLAAHTGREELLELMTQLHIDYHTCMLVILHRNKCFKKQ